ncbi:MAG TPA: threonine--tRNA ligase [Polyangiaceae bacterium]|jgi:threonyl-tRNA synthetase|nr:threonine--tRNA ligase [Polyangiaceae bacterium]
MIEVKLPDGSRRELQDGASAFDLARDIGPGLSKNAVAAKVNGAIWDLRVPLPSGAEVALLTKKDPEALDVLRHSAAHLMADAILRLFPKAQLTIGPAIEDGFYYDIYLPDGGKITPEDFPALEAEMARLAKDAAPFERRVVKDKTDEVYARYQAIDGGHNKFKAELVEGIRERGEELSFFKHGEFVDLCRGPHVQDTGWLKNIKLTKVSGSYWRADATREQLVRVYGTAFFSKTELDDYLKALEEAKKRDHRVLGEQLNLFIFNDDAPGFPFFLPKGASLFNQLIDYMRGHLKRLQYQEVRTPLILSEHMWHTSGHYDNYLENMFFTKLKLRDEEHPGQIKDNVEEERPMAVKPMNCPGHLMVYRSRLHSHNEFPLRIAEMGLVHRRELSGVRHGLFRVQAFTQDDAHHFCTPDQISDEIRMLIDFFREVYSAFDLNDVRIELSTRPEKSIGSDEMWEKAESSLKVALDAAGIEYKINPGDGAFYGPKIDFHIRDVLKRSWQCGTIQLDFSMPARFGLSYIGPDGEKHTPVMLHRACYGSLERFLGIIIENYAGAFPTWLSPVQFNVIPVSERFDQYASKVTAELIAAGLRGEADLGAERVGYKIRQASLNKVPYVIVVGEKELESGNINVRSRQGGELGAMSIAAFLDSIAAERVPGSRPTAAAAE